MVGACVGAVGADRRGSQEGGKREHDGEKRETRERQEGNKKGRQVLCVVVCVAVCTVVCAVVCVVVCAAVCGVVCAVVCTSVQAVVTLHSRCGHAAVTLRSRCGHAAITLDQEGDKREARGRQEGRRGRPEETRGSGWGEVGVCMWVGWLWWW